MGEEDGSGRERNWCLRQGSFIDQYSSPREDLPRDPAPSQRNHPPLPPIRKSTPTECPARVAECTPGSIWLKKSREVARGQGRAQRVPKGVSRESEEPPGEGALGAGQKGRRGNARKPLGPAAPSESQTTCLRH